MLRLAITGCSGKMGQAILVKDVEYSVGAGGQEDAFAHTVDAAGDLFLDAPQGVGHARRTRWA